MIGVRVDGVMVLTVAAAAAAVYVYAKSATVAEVVDSVFSVSATSAKTEKEFQQIEREFFEAQGLEPEKVDAALEYSELGTAGQWSKLGRRIWNWDWSSDFK